MIRISPCPQLFLRKRSDVSPRNLNILRIYVHKQMHPLSTHLCFTSREEAPHFTYQRNFEFLSHNTDNYAVFCCCMLILYIYSFAYLFIMKLYMDYTSMKNTNNTSMQILVSYKFRVFFCRRHTALQRRYVEQSTSGFRSTLSKVFHSLPQLERYCIQNVIWF